MKKKRKFYPTAALLFTFIAAVTVSDLVNPVCTFSEMENRELKTSSRLTLSRVVSGDFQKRYEEVLADQFVGRDGWITLKSETESALLKTENNGVLYGKNGALFGKLISCNEEQLEKNAGFIRTFAESHENVTFGVIQPISSPSETVSLTRSQSSTHSGKRCPKASVGLTCTAFWKQRKVNLFTTAPTTTGKERPPLPPTARSAGRWGSIPPFQRTI